MQNAAAPPPTWVRFTAGSVAAAGDGERVDRYRVEQTTTVRGAPLLGIEAGAMLTRIESTLGVPAGTGDLVGVTAPLAYTRAAERAELASPAPTGSPTAHAVMIPISRQSSWWGLAHDERDHLFRGAGKSDGHVTVGRPYAPRLFRKLYHGRSLPGAGWDFLTYFEFEPELADDFRALCVGLRDPERNPEWETVERETEIWLKKVG